MGLVRLCQSEIFWSFADKHQTSISGHISIRCNISRRDLHWRSFQYISIMSSDNLSGYVRISSNFRPSQSCEQVRQKFQEHNLSRKMKNNVQHLGKGHFSTFTESDVGIKTNLSKPWFNHPKESPKGPKVQIKHFDRNMVYCSAESNMQSEPEGCQSI